MEMGLGRMRQSRGMPGVKERRKSLIDMNYLTSFADASSSCLLERMIFTLEILDGSSHIPTKYPLSPNVLHPLPMEAR